MNSIPNGKGHETVEETTAAAKTPPGDTTEQSEDPEANLAESQEFLSNMEDKKTTRFTDFEGKTSFGMSVFNLGNAIMGSGILGLSYAMANTGIRAYEQLGQRAFGTPGKMAAGIAITLQNIGVWFRSEWYLNGNYLVIMVSISVILPLALMKQLGYLGYTSGFSLTCMVFFLISVIYKKFHTPCPFLDFTFNSTASVTAVTNDTGYNPACVPKMVNLNSQTAYTIPILAFAFVCHPEVLPIYTELKNPTKQRMQHVSNISIVVMYTIRLDPYDTLILCVRLAVLTAVTLTVPIVLFPVRRAIQQLFFPNKTFYWPRHIAIAVTLLTLINMLVIFAPNILGIFGIIGATSAPCLIFIFPAVFYIRIVPEEEEPMRSTPKILVSDVP
ncbi:unnamed protein product, partial [Coregonus sp. 'balchen']